MAKILFICTSGKDRSFSLVKYFSEKYPQHEYRCAGINKFFTSQKGTHLVTQEDVDWADLVVYAEDVHREKISNWGVIVPSFQKSVILNSGKYEVGNISAEYLQKSDLKLQSVLNNLI